MHIPVLVNEVIEFLKPENGKTYVDATIGCGGYTEKLLSLCPNCKVIGIDWDSAAIDFSKERLKHYIEKGNLIIVKQNFINIKEIIAELKINTIAGAMFDFGFSTLQIKSGRGFSFNDEILDMRMDPSQTVLTASYILNNYSEKQLYEIFLKYGEERYSKFIAKEIVEYRKNKQINSAKDLIEIFKKISKPKNKEIFLKDKKQKLKFKFNPITKILQALRIFINNELYNIEVGLNNTIDILSSKGRIVAVSYHSLEDRIVKNIFRKRNDIKIITKKPVTPKSEEILNNISSRSAKLRAAEKL
mgnify:CR=1 FL=1